MAHETVFTNFQLTEFRELLSSCVSESLKKEIGSFSNPAEPQKQILTRQEAAAELTIYLPTLHDYTKRGVIQAYRLGYKVRYKREDINKALQQIKTKI
ncbi:MAG: helix-turn-helix domain-containing protein [Phormidesmis sp. FL-bin-119]|nr:helix-turn-helix domain-containing protein [Pedobacter sp.]